MRELVSEIIRRCGKVVSLSRFDLSRIVRPLPALGPGVGEYFSSCVPEGYVEGPFHSLLSPEGIRYFNEELLPGCYTSPAGFVTFASEPNGDAVAVEVARGRVFVLSHEIYDEDGIDDYPDELEITLENIVNTAEHSWSDIRAFLEDWRRQLLELEI